VTTHITLIYLVCRNIGKLARTIKNRKDPEQNLVNRYMLGIGTQHSLLRSTEDDLLDESDEHPLVPLGAVNSTLIQAVLPIRWPALTKQNHRRLYKDHSYSHISSRVFTPLLGVGIVKRNHGKANSFKGYGTDSPVHVGAWKFHSTPLDDGFIAGTCHSYFAIRAKWIHTEADWHATAEPEDPDRVDEYDPEQLLFGMIHRFIRLETVYWNNDDRLHLIAQCTLWRPRATSLCGYPLIHPTEDVVTVPDANGNGVKAQFIPLRHIETQVMFGPVVTGWKDRTKPREKDRDIRHTGKYVAIALQL
jgi:hypothetical protein